MNYLDLLDESILDKVNRIELDETIYPPKDVRFLAFELTPIDKIKVVILGQDPYHGENEANGLAFSVDIPKLPPSLKNIYKELENDLGIIKTDGNLRNWAKQGVLLLNTILTVSKDKPLSHKDIGWQDFTIKVIKAINQLDRPICFVLWGSYARSYKKYLTNTNHLIIEGVHPSPLSSYRGFFGSKPFSKINDYLIKNGLSPIDFK